MARNQGFILLEWVAAMLLLGGLLLLFGQWLQQQQRVIERQQWVRDTERLLHDSELFWLRYGRAPQDLQELQTTMAWPQSLHYPWQQAWQWQADATVMRVQLQTPSAAAAAWFASQFVQAQAVADQVHWQLLAPLQASVDDERYLHRLPQPDRPHLNQLESHLDMQQYDLRNVGQLVALHGRINSLQTQQLLTGHLQADQLQAAQVQVQQLHTAQGEISAYFALVDDYLALWQQCRASGGCQ